MSKCRIINDECRLKSHDCNTCKIWLDIVIEGAEGDYRGAAPRCHITQEKCMANKNCKECDVWENHVSNTAETEVFYDESAETLDYAAVPMDCWGEEECQDEACANYVNGQCYLNARQWIPVEQQLPSVDGRFEVTILNDKGAPYVDMCNYNKDGGKFMWGDGYWKVNVVAWRERGIPYVG